MLVDIGAVFAIFGAVGAAIASLYTIPSRTDPARSAWTGGKIRDGRIQRKVCLIILAVGAILAVFGLLL